MVRIHMTSPLKSILITDWSREHIAGFDLDGGTIASFTLDASVADPEALGYEPAKWKAGDIATLKIDAETQLARLRIVTPKASILRLREFQIFDIVHATDKNGAPHDGDGRHIFLKGTAENGAVYVMPMLGYTIWTAAWDLTGLTDALQRAQIRQQQESGLTTLLSHEITTQRIGGDRLKPHIDRYNEIFYPGSRQAGTVFDNAASLVITGLIVSQAGAALRAQMLSAAFVKKLKPDIRKGQDPAAEKMGTAFSPPYFVIDGEKVFIRTSPAPGRKESK